MTLECPPLIQSFNSNSEFNLFQALPFGELVVFCDGELVMSKFEVVSELTPVGKQEARNYPGGNIVTVLWRVLRKTASSSNL